MVATTKQPNYSKPVASDGYLPLDGSPTGMLEERLLQDMGRGTSGRTPHPNELRNRMMLPQPRHDGCCDNDQRRPIQATARPVSSSAKHSNRTTSSAFVERQRKLKKFQKIMMLFLVLVFTGAVFSIFRLKEHDSSHFASNSSTANKEQKPEEGQQ